jgi:hypothetical protein
MDEDELRVALSAIEPRGRELLRRALIQDQADRDGIASQLLRYRDERGDDWADVIDMLTLHSEARKRVVRLLGEIEGRRVTLGGRARRANGEGSIRPSFASPLALGHPASRLRPRFAIQGAAGSKSLT